MNPVVCRVSQEQLDKISRGYISNLLRRGDLEGKPGQMLLLHHVPNVLSERNCSSDAVVLANHLFLCLFSRCYCIVHCGKTAKGGAPCD